MSPRSRVTRLLLGAVAVFAFVTAFSMVRYVLAHPGYGVQQNVATWARNKGMGKVVDWLESVVLNDPPSSAPADSLALAPVPDSTVTPAPTVTAAGTTTTSAVTTTVPSTTTTVGDLAGVTTTSTTPPVTTTTLPPPVDLSPVISPALRNEGEWKVLFTMGRSRRPVMWATSIRPFPEYGSVVATAAVFDQTRLRAAMFNGPDIPGKGEWTNWRKIPTAAVPSLVAAFNGGFRFEHEPGGYRTEGVTVRRIKRGLATVAIDPEGVLRVGVWGDDMRASDGWVTVRQNLPPLVHRGRVSWRDFKFTDWGSDYGNKVYTYRSALCRRTDGTTMFAAANDVNIELLARMMHEFGCYTAMEMDINGTWPHFSTYTRFGSTNRYGMPLDRRMGDPQRYLIGYDKDFFALFDPKRLPDGVVR